MAEIDLSLDLLRLRVALDERCTESVARGARNPVRRAALARILVFIFILLPVLSRGDPGESASIYIEGGEGGGN